MSDDFLNTLKDIEWFSSSGEEDSSLLLVDDAVEPFDNPEFQSFKVWSEQTHLLETKALETLSDSEIDEIFTKTSSELYSKVSKGIELYFENREIRTENMELNVDLGMWQEILNTVMRDLAWANVENSINHSGFFTSLIEFYRDGRWPCGWSGTYPEGSVVLL